MIKSAPTSVWIIVETTTVRHGQESQDCEYSTRIFEVFSNQRMAQANCDFYNDAARKTTSSDRYSVKEMPVWEKLSPEVEKFLEKSRSKEKEVLQAQLIEAWKTVKDIENKLRGCDA